VNQAEPGPNNARDRGVSLLSNGLLFEERKMNVIDILVIVTTVAIFYVSLKISKEM